MEEVFKITKDKERAEDLYLLALDRFEFIPHYPKDKTYKIIEEYYESIKELLTSYMYLEGYKTLSHVALIEFVKLKIDILDRNDFVLIDNLRKFRNGTMYYGEKISKDFLVNYERDIKSICEKLLKFIKEELK